MTLALTVLGCSGTHPGPQRMCSSYLVEHDGYRLLVDCGNGSLSNLTRRCDVADVDAVVLSHLHPDHFADLYGLYYALRFHRDGARAVPVYAPAGAPAFIGRLLDDLDTFTATCRFTPAQAGDVLRLGPLTVRLFAAAHPVDTLALRIEAAGTVLAYSADSAPTPALSDAARDADLFLCDATWLERQRPLPSAVHMTAEEAGRQAGDAGAKRLVLTHLWPTNDPAESAAEAARAYVGAVTVAADLDEFVL